VIVPRASAASDSGPPQPPQRRTREDIDQV
jgi:hypothetical protein